MFGMPETIRAEEQWSLRKTDVNRAKRRITVRASEAKSGKSRSIPLTDRAWEIIERRLLSNVPTEYVFCRWIRDELTGEERPERIEHTWAYREFQKGIAAAGLDDVEWHRSAAHMRLPPSPRQGLHSAPGLEVAWPLKRQGHGETTHSYTSMTSRSSLPRAHALKLSPSEQSGNSRRFDVPIFVPARSAFVTCSAYAALGFPRIFRD